MNTCTLCDVEKSDTISRNISLLDEHGRPLNGVVSVGMVVCEQCYDDLPKQNSLARQRFEQIFR